MKQKTFTFTKYFVESYDKNKRPSKFFSWKDHFVSKLNKQGYVCTGIKELETITITCYASRANVPIKERERLQKKILKQNPPTKVYLLK